MPVLAVVNRKGGSGKSTLAAHLAAHAANAGASVMVADVDRQQSMRAWLRERNAHTEGPRAAITACTVESRGFVRPPAGVDLVVVDTPGGLTGLDLARVVMYADAILMPVCNSLFDRESAADCVAELRKLPRVASGRCRLAAIGMRVEAGSEAVTALQAWAANLKVPFLTSLRESVTYVRCAEQGLSLFDLPPAVAQSHVPEWQPLLDWLQTTLQAPSEGVVSAAGTVSANDPRIAPAAPARVPARPLDAAARASVHPLPVSAARPPAPVANARLGRLLDALPIPRFLQRGV